MNALTAALMVANKFADVGGALAEVNLYIAAERFKQECVEAQVVEPKMQAEWIDAKTHLDDLHMTREMLWAQKGALQMAHKALLKLDVTEIEGEAEEEFLKLLNTNVEAAQAYASDVDDMLAEDESDPY